MPSQTVTTTVRLPHPLKAVLPILHSPSTMITLNPLVISYSPPTSTKPHWTITDRLPLFSCFSTTTTYTAVHTEEADGCRFEIEAGFGVKTRSRWMVVEVEGGEVEVCEESRVETPWGVLGMVMGQVKESHGILIKRLEEEIKKRNTQVGNWPFT